MWILLSLATAATPAWNPPDAMVDAYNDAVKAANAGDFARADATLERLLKKAPDCGLALALQGQVRTRENRPADALAPLERAVTLFPDHVEAWANLADASFAAQDFPRAQEAARRSVALAPADPRVVDGSVAPFVRTGDYDAAVALVEGAKLGEAERACVIGKVAYEANDRAQAQAQWDVCQKSSEDVLVSELRVRLAGEGDLASTAAHVETLGADAYGLVIRAAALFNDGQPGDALPLVDLARAQLPHDAGVALLRAQCLLALHRYPEAATELKAVVDSADWVDVHASGAFTGVTTRRLEVRLDEVRRQAAATLVRLERDRGGGGGDRALADARTRFGEYPALTSEEAELRVAQGRPAEAWSLLRAAEARWPSEAGLAAAIARVAVTAPDGLDDASAAYVRDHGVVVDVLNLAVAESNGRRWDACLADVDRALAADAKAPRAAEVGYTCAAAGAQPDRAYAYLVRVPTPPSPAVYAHAVALYDAGRGDEAVSLLATHPVHDAELEGPAADLLVSCHVAASRWTEAIGVVEGGHVGLHQRLWLGQELLNARHERDAARVLAGACPAAQGEERRVCEEILKAAAR